VSGWIEWKGEREGEFVDYAMYAPGLAGFRAFNRNFLRAR